MNETKAEQKALNPHPDDMETFANAARDRAYIARQAEAMNETNQTRSYKVFDCFGYPKSVVSYTSLKFAKDAAFNISTMCGHRTEVRDSDTGKLVAQYSGRE